MTKGKKTKSTSRKKPIEQYAHKRKQQANNPPVGLGRKTGAAFV